MSKISRTLTLSLLLTSLSLTACLKQKNQQPQVVAKPHVQVATVNYRAYTEHFNFPGRIEAKDSVLIKTRVPGFLKDRLFNEGDIVTQGQELFIIEQEQFEAKVIEAKANVAKAEADAVNSKLNYERALELRRSDNISKATKDAREADYKGATAKVLQAKAALRLAELDLDYTIVRAPFNGKIGLSQYSGGEFLPNNTVLAKLVSDGPVNVVFSIAENELLKLQQAGVLGTNKLNVSLIMADNSVYKYSGKINFTDVTVDDSTDTIKLRAEFPNPNGSLISGQFVNVLLEYDATNEKIIMPQKALISSPTGKIAYTIDSKGIVVLKQITVGPEQGSNIVVMSGLEAGEKVITDGLQKVRPGMEVIVDQPKAKVLKAPIDEDLPKAENSTVKGK